MTAVRIDGKVYAQGLRDRVKTVVAKLKADHDLTPGLAVVLVGADPASEVYVASKHKACEEAGIASFQHYLPEDTAQDDLLALIDQLNNDPKVHGILVQVPLPGQISEDEVIAAINPDKDVDGFHLENRGRLTVGMPAPYPCTPVGCVLLAKDALGNDLSGKEVVVIGRSNIVGKPVAQLFIHENCTVTVAHSKTHDLPAVCRRADILVPAIGVPHFVKADWIKPGACVIDVGVNRIPAPEKGDNKVVIRGDVEKAAKDVAGFLTPVPGGVGPMTIACLLRGTVLAACAQEAVSVPEGLDG